MRPTAARRVSVGTNFQRQETRDQETRGKRQGTREGSIQYTVFSIQGE
jgi:hypothetical protein